MNRVGVIVIGSNSVRFMLTEVEDGGYFRVIDELSSSIRLCENLIDSNEIPEEKITETLSVLKSFKSLYTISGAKKVIAVATETFSTAKNKDNFINLVEDVLGIKVTILSTHDEVYYNYLGVVKSIYFKNCLLVDISGNCTHVSFLSNNEIKDTVTLPLGCVNISYLYNLKDRVLRDDLDKALIHIREEITKLEKFKDFKFDSIIGVGGTIRAIAKMDRFKKKYPFNITHNYTTNDLDIHDIYNLVKSKNLLQRKRIEGLSTDRADIIVGGSAIFQEIISYFDIANITVSGRDLKEGIMFEYIDNNFSPIDDILDYSINGIIENLNINKNHAKHVYNITNKLFNSLKPLHHLDNKYDHVIKTASMLHDCGISIDYYNHHLHSFYIILNSYINGLTHKELLLSAAIAAFHRNNSYHFPMPQYCSICNKLDIKAIEFIGVLLRIAEGLDRSLEGSVEDIEVIIDENSVILNISSHEDLKLEIEQALRASKKFNEIYDKSLIIKKIEKSIS